MLVVLSIWTNVNQGRKSIIRSGRSYTPTYKVHTVLQLNHPLHPYFASPSSLSSSPPSSPSPEWPWVGIGSQGCMHLRRSSQIASPTRSRTCCTLGLEAMNYYYVLLQDEKGFATDFEFLSSFFWYFHGNCHLNFSSLSRRGFFLDLTSFLIWNSFPFRLKLTVADKTLFQSTFRHVLWKLKESIHKI